MKRLVAFLLLLFLSFPSLAGKWTLSEDKDLGMNLVITEGNIVDGRKAMFSFTHKTDRCMDLKFALTIPITKERADVLKSGTSKQAFDGELRVDELSLLQFKYLITRNEGESVLFLPIGNLDEDVLISEMQKGKILRIKTGPVTIRIPLDGFGEVWAQSSRMCGKGNPDEKFFDVPPAKTLPSERHLVK